MPCHRFHVTSPRCGRRSRARRGQSLAVARRAFYRPDFAQPSGTKNPSMTRVCINYDGWLALPTAVRRKLGLATGDQLELELSDGGSIVLRPVRSGAAEPAPAPVAMAEPSVPATPPTAAAAAPMVKRGPGRPRKTPLPVVPPTLKARGGRRKTAAATEPRP